MKNKPVDPNPPKPPESLLRRLYKWFINLFKKPNTRPVDPLPPKPPKP